MLSKNNEKRIDYNKAEDSLEIWQKKFEIIAS
jgi:hypothetical protein